jgi:hypothetical protein
LFVPANCANEPRPVPNLRAWIGGLLDKHLDGEFARISIRRQDGIVPLFQQGCGAAEVQSIIRHRRTVTNVGEGYVTSPAACEFAKDYPQLGIIRPALIGRITGSHPMH